MAAADRRQGSLSMTVAVEETRKQYEANAGQTVFTYPCRLFKESDLQVYKTDSGKVPDPVLDKLALNIDYTVQGVESGNRTITLNVAASEGDLITLERDISADRDTDFNTGGDFSPQLVNRQFDKFVMLVQQNKDRQKYRGLTYSATDELEYQKDNVLPKLEANQIWKKNDDGNLVAVTLVENPDVSTLRSELANNLEQTPGAKLVGFYEPDVGSTNVNAIMLSLIQEVKDLKNEINAFFPTGIMRATHRTTPTPGFILFSEGTIGSASSGATVRANNDTEALFKLYWNNISDTYCPVTGGRGADANADWSANKQIALPRIAGRAIAAAGAGDGLSVRELGFYLGEEVHQLTEAEMPSHTHPTTGKAETTEFTGPGGNLWNGDAGTNTGSTGGDQAHNNMQPTAFTNWEVKL